MHCVECKWYAKLVVRGFFTTRHFNSVLIGNSLSDNENAPPSTAVTTAGVPDGATRPSRPRPLLGASRPLRAAWWPRSLLKPRTSALNLVPPLVLEALAKGGLVAWIGSIQRMFFPPDMAAADVDLAALPMARVDGLTKGAGAADTLLRSGCFTLIVLNWNAQAFPLAQQNRLSDLPTSLTPLS